MSALHIPLSTYAHDDRAVGVLLHRDDAARLLTLAGGRRGVLQRALRVCFKTFGGARLAAMSKELVSDELWRTIKPLLPAEPYKAKGGRPRIPDRAVLSGIVFVLRSGIPWRILPKEMGFGSGITCWRRVPYSRGKQ